MTQKKDSFFPYYIFIMAIYPTISLWAENYQQVKPGVVLRPIVFSILVSLGIYYGLLFIFKDKLKAGAVGTFSVFLFLNYGRTYSTLIERNQWFQSQGRLNHLYLILSFLLISYIFLKVYEKINIFDSIAITGICVALLLLPSFQIGKLIVQEQKPYLPVDIELSPTYDNEELPDIYHIIVDAYSRQDYLAQLGFDNSDFINFLKGQGFYVADCSKSNYSRTALSLTSTLNLDYLWRIFPDKNIHDRDDTAIYSALSNNLVHNELRNLGYQFITTENGYYWSEHTKYADLLVKQDKPEFLRPYLSPFEKIFVQSTALRLLTDFIDFDELFNGYILNGLHYEQVQYSLSYLEKIPTIPGPKYVYYHITVPHDPYIFSPDGSISSPLRGSQGYIRNIQFINSAMKPLLTNIIKQSEVPPVIIIQGDHGSMLDNENRFLILFAIYMPYGTSELYPSISPVNTYRVIFNQLFNTNFSLLKDKSIQADIGAPFRKNEAKLSEHQDFCP
ncbi:MAG: hypothetical protein P8Y72_13680 [Anaerolineales bacterium]